MWLGSEAWKMGVRSRLGLALAVGLATALLYAEGVLKNGLIEVVLLVPVVWYLFVPTKGVLLQNLLFSLLIMCIAVSGFDLLLRPVMERRLNYTPLNVYSHKLPKLPIVGRWDPNLNLVDELYGDLAAIADDPKLREPRQVVFKTDAAGFRNDDVSEKIDLLILGDSFGAGWATTQDRIYASLLQSQYGQRIYNLSYPGGPYDQYVNFAIEWPRLEFASSVKMVWTFYTGNDLDDSGGQVWDLEALPWRSPLGEWQVRYRTFRGRSPINRLANGLRWRLLGDKPDVISRVLPDGRSMLFLTGHEVWGSRSRTEVERHPNFAKLERTLQEMHKLTIDRGVEVTILLFPTKGEVYRWILDQRPAKSEDGESSGFAKAVLAACQRVGFRCLDTKPYLVQKALRLFESSGELLWWRDDSHLGERGHEAIAAFIVKKVLASGIENLKKKKIDNP